MYSHVPLGIHSEGTDSEVDESDWAYGDQWIGSGLLIGTDYQHTIIVGGEPKQTPRIIITIETVTCAFPWSI